MGERGDILRTMQRAIRGHPRELAVFEPGENAPPIIGRVAAKGMADELYDRGYLVVDGLDGKAHYVPLPANTELGQYPIGGIVEARRSGEVRSADKSIAALAVGGLYRTDHHLAIERARLTAERDPSEVVQAHIRRLEALRRGGIVTRLTEGVWQVPADLPEQGRQFDLRQRGATSVTLRSHLSIVQQTRAVGATWLDRTLIGGSRDIGERGFGAEVHEALQQRTAFLSDQELATRHGQRTVLARGLLATLQERDLMSAAGSIAHKTGLSYKPAVDGERVTGTYRRSVLLASGRFAMLDDGIGFSLVPWKQVIERRLGKTLTAVVRDGGVSWELGRTLGI